MVSELQGELSAALSKYNTLNKHNNDMTNSFIKSFWYWAYDASKKFLRNNVDFD